MNTQERALAKAKEKAEEILWESPEGVSISALTGTLRISKSLAISALAALGAVEQNGVWVLPDDEVAPGAKTDTAVVNENFTTELSGNSGELPASTVNPVDPCPMPCIDQPVEAPSDHSPVFNNILDRVLQTIKTYGGATADRVRELTGMHPDDIADAVQFMVDHGQLVGRSVYFATVYEVAA